MEHFLSDEFLLDTPAARSLYHGYAEGMPIVDYHCHIDPREIFEDSHYENITRIWLGADHYKWRLMRSNGVDESFITGNASDREKFQKFAESLPRAIGNPMYHWCHLELKNYFGYNGVLNGDTAQQVWDLCNDRLENDPAMSARGLILSSKVIMVGTTDDPCSDLIWHKKLAEDEDFPVQVCPSFRLDPVLNIQKPGFAEYMTRLAETTGKNLDTIEDVRSALSERIAYFDKNGCRAADHGLDYMMFRVVNDEQATQTLHKALTGQRLTREEAEGYQTALQLHCAREYKAHGWVMQLHFSCIRNPNQRMFEALGADCGFDCIAVTNSCDSTYALMDALEREGNLPKTVLYSLNPSDNEWIDTLLGAFQSREIPGKIQHGSAWWFNDNKTGMMRQLESLGNQSVLGNFIGMLTDSRSFLSYTRHEYFRRVLCSLLGRWIENGEYPDDLEYAGSLVKDICTNNAVRYFCL